MPAIEDQIGRVVGGRYRLLAPLGAGSSAQVYLADDVNLQRQVAVKMLQPGLAGDRVFLERFRAEAQTVASVNHPNIVVVHDSGVDDVPYLVTEFLAGGSLRGMLATGYRLSLSQALLVGLDTCRGLAHAHGRGLVHRDLKPANILFGDDGRLRIADFGVARALADSGLTDHDGSLVGTVRYVAPEQALGLPSGPKADVYALALVLVEAVTGQVPFAGTDPRATLLARTTDDLEVPDRFGPLRSAIERAGRLDVDERADAEELGIALLAASELLEAPAPLPLVGALREAGDTLEPDEHTQIAPAPLVTADADAAPEVAQVDGAAAAGDEAPRRRRRWPIVLAVLLAVVAGAGGFLAYQQLRTPTHEIPELVGRQIDELELVAEQYDWQLDEKKTRQDGTEPGEIVSTEPAFGERLEEGGVLVVLVSEGNELTDRPADLAGRPLADVVVDLEAAGLDYEVTEAFDEEVPADHVIGTDGEVPTELPKGEVVPLLVSKGPEPRTVPQVPDGADYDTAAKALEDLRLVPVREDVFSDDVPEGQVIAIQPAAGTEVPRGAEITVRVSKGPDLVTVPELKGLKLDEAEQKLIEAGLVLGQDCCASNGRVIGSDPPEGTQVKRGTAVNLFLARKT